ncbi:uncharacterized protein [Rutidosis leptorrhynchoides]|uniref:uncharacterized protein n=1 Tax=Rutidosis leptorrhynchoides TaxID=125765 RepID=UPI003A997FE6
MAATLLQTLLPFLLPSIIVFLPIITTPPFSIPTYLRDHNHHHRHCSGITNTLGFHSISVVAANDITISTATTIFAPTDVSLQSCPYCSLPLLLLEHSVSGLYPFNLLTKLTFGTKIQTLATSTHLCLTLTKSKSTINNHHTLFINGVQITQPDVYNDGHVIIHGIQGYLAHLSPFSCQIERMTSLSFYSRPYYIMRASLTDAVYRLRSNNDYSVLALLIQENLDMLSELYSLTIFAVDDANLFGDGNTFVSNLRFHIVPNRRLIAVDLLNLPVDSELPMRVDGQRLMVTVAGAGDLLAPMRINNMKITNTDVVVNEGIVVHGIAAPFPRVSHTSAMGFWPADHTDFINLGPIRLSDTS